MAFKPKSFFTSGLNIGFLNICSLYYKVPEVRLLCDKFKFDVLALNETWLNKDIADNEISIPGYNILRNDRESHGGGTAFYIKDDIKYVDREDIYKNHDIESCWIELSNKNENVLLIGNIYRPPSSNSQHYYKMLDLLTQINSEGKDTVILGDLNFNCLDKIKYNSIRTLENMFDMTQMVRSPTRLSVKIDESGSVVYKDSLIDVILTNVPNKHHCTSVIHTTISDHYLVKTIVKYKKESFHKTITFRDYKHFCENEFKYELHQEFSKAKVDTINNTDTAWNCFKEIFNKVSNKHAPLVTRRLKARSCPWMSLEIVKLIYERDYYHGMFRKTKSLEMWDKYKKFRNSVTSLIRNTKRTFYENQINNLAGNPNQLWKLLNNVIPNTKSNSDTHTFSANQYNKHFCSVGENIANSFKSNKQSYPWKGPNSVYKFKFSTITKEVVALAINNMPNKSSLDILNMDIKLLKISKDIITDVLCHIFNLSIKQSKFCDDWKVARVSPAYKGKGVKNDLNNYRPISNISHVAKIMERIINKQFVNYLTKHDFINVDQSAYRANHSTTTALHRVMEDWLEALNDNQFIGIVYLDTKKCFDSIDHKILLHKLKRYGVVDIENKWFNSYLNNRSQKVFINNDYSEPGALKSGVPQGSILGPTLFLLYINDLSQHSFKACVNIYSDDVLIYYASNDFEELRKILQTSIDSISQWYYGNRLLLSSDKCGAMVITNKSQTENLNLNIGGSDLTEVDNFKYLGVIIDNKLNFNLHVESKVSKVKSKLYALRRLRNILPQSSLIKLYRSIIQTGLDYSITVWGNTSQNNMINIDRQQKMAARIIMDNFDFINTRGDNLCNLLNLQCFQDRLKYSTCCLMYKCIHGLVPDYLSNHILYEFEIHNHVTRTAINNDLYLPFPCIEQYKQSLFYNGAKTWNNLSNLVRDSTSLNTFKRNYKRSYFH